MGITKDTMKGGGVCRAGSTQVTARVTTMRGRWQASRSKDARAKGSIRQHVSRGSLEGGGRWRVG